MYRNLKWRQTYNRIINHNVYCYNPMGGHYPTVGQVSTRESAPGSIPGLGRRLVTWISSLVVTNPRRRKAVREGLSCCWASGWLWHRSFGCTVGIILYEKLRRHQIRSQDADHMSAARVAHPIHKFPRNCLGWFFMLQGWVYGGGGGRIT